MASSFSAQERQYYDKLFDAVDKDGSGVLPGQDALPFLTSSRLSQQTLGEVWAIADPGNNGFLTKDGWYKAARIIGWLQKGGQTTVQESLASRPGPLPTFEGQAPPPTQFSGSAGAAASSGGASLPPLTPADRTKFTRIFVSCGPQNGLVSGDKAREVFLKSKLDYEKLGQIWNLADTQQRGNLDLTDFIVAMYLIQSSMANPSLTLPSTLPNGVYEAASGGRPAARTGPMSPIVSQHTGGSTGSPIRAQHTGTPALQQQLTGQSATGVPPRSSTITSLASASAFAPNTPAWDVSSEEKAASDRFFSQLDTQNRGVIDGDVAVPFMLQSQLDETSLASIWDLADIRHEGKLDRDEFAVALHLINAKLAGQNIPSVLPSSLVPPSLRSTFQAAPQNSSSGPSSVTKDLFDLFDDEPTMAAPIASSPASPAPASRAPPSTTTFLPQPPSRKSTVQTPRQPFSPAPTSVFASTFAPSSDLLGDEAGTPSNITDASADVGNMRNQLSATNENLDKLGKSRGELEQSAQASQDEISQLETDLSNARVRHEAESKAVSDLRARVSEQKDKVQELRGSVIAAESDLSAMKSEKDELEQALLRDKEEVRSLQKRMKDVNDEKTSLKALLEKLRKEARQQKGMVSIAKKQLATSETGRDAAQKDLDLHTSQVAEAAAIPLPSTPRALSPVATGVSQRSNNPFDRLGLSRSESREQPVNDSTRPKNENVLAPVDTDDRRNSESPQGQSATMNQVPTNPSADEALTSKGAEALFEDDPFGSSIEDPISASVAADHTSKSPDSGPPAPSQKTDFDAAFADFDDEPQHTLEDGDKNASASFDEPDSLDGPLQASLSAQDMSPAVQDEHQDLNPAQKTTAVETSPIDESPIENQQAIEEDTVSSDDDEGPEDLEGAHPYRAKEDTVVPSPDVASSTPAITQTVDKIRRSAPAPPVRSTEPSGSQATAAAEGPKSSPKSSQRSPDFANFDDEDFDFTDQPPSTVQQTGVSEPSKAFDDEFAAFDDEFDSKTPSQPNTGSDNSKSFELVSPPANGGQLQASKAFATEDRDEWGMLTAGSTSNAPPLSFDDAFGSAFEPSPSFEPPAEAPTSHLQPPAPPERRATEAQVDDIEDVKKASHLTGFSSANLATVMRHGLFALPGRRGIGCERI
ncbi:hypothetical protein BD324DRAFT_634936 [Kockovaella imperatae]|uniref:Uncharacterized protein n=1 Tax=Kockovaella imperatae TaxID=4999 RepID=A0A1Y1UB96_9TREE|nr:hypothetical protein BD324DRAFT_634936 [Kockovaella imperatae]ORX34776.1 hypothetical protein BD324DRAFT_634936 [Kockovaella imperatae]